jgi:hypothetical protein
MASSKPKGKNGLQQKSWKAGARRSLKPGRCGRVAFAFKREGDAIIHPESAGPRKQAATRQKFHHTATTPPCWLLVLTVQTVENTPT